MIGDVDVCAIDIRTFTSDIKYKDTIIARIVTHISERKRDKIRAKNEQVPRTAEDDGGDVDDVVEEGPNRKLGCGRISNESSELEMVPQVWRPSLYPFDVERESYQRFSSPQSTMSTKPLGIHSQLDLVRVQVLTDLQFSSPATPTS